MEELIDELKLKIFQYCTGSLKDLCNVNKHFATMITESPELMLKMPLVLESKRKEEKYKSILRSQRKFQKIIVRYDYNFGESGMKIIRKFSGSLKHLKFVRCIFGAHQFREILESCPHLESLEIHTSYIRQQRDCFEEVEDTTEITPLPYNQLSDLKQLTIRKSDDRFLKFLFNCKFVKIEFGERDSEVLQTFLANQRFVQELEFYANFDEVILQSYANMENLTKVALQIEKISLEPVTATCRNVKKLHLWSESSDKDAMSNSFEAILKVFPNVLALIIESNHITKRMVEILNEKLENLERLSVPNIVPIEDPDFCYFEAIKLPNLKHFEYGGDQTPAEWENFIKKHPNIESFYFTARDFNDELFLVLNGWKNLKILKLMMSGGAKLTEKSFDALASAEQFQNLKILKFREVSPEIPNLWEDLKVLDGKYKEKLEEARISIFRKH